ncbi:S8 family serine peptidase [Streptomyces sp. NBC_01602]|uniref:S8 family serine peptidase n=1 Tax=Streptomyces sp. NBC_01602 TaxID=2975893 RepID=UPI00386C4A53
MPSVGAVHQPPGSGGIHSATLITGDEVTIGTAAESTAIRSFEGPNGTITGFRRSVVDGSTYVYPKVAVLDTGVDTEPLDLVGKFDATVSFVPGEQEMTDYVGHGTHVASTIAGTGGASDAMERGVAPGARLDVGKVLKLSGRRVVSTT